jgi:hypothetical protein
MVMDEKLSFLGIPTRDFVTVNDLHVMTRPTQSSRQIKNAKMKKLAGIK